jgi:hypothetical protein
MAGTRIDDDAVRKVAARHNGRSLRAIRVHGMNATRIQFEDE